MLQDKKPPNVKKDVLIIGLMLVAVLVTSGCIQKAQIDMDETRKKADYVNGVWVEHDCSNDSFIYVYYLKCNDDFDYRYKDYEAKMCSDKKVIVWRDVYKEYCTIKEEVLNVTG
jgi:hypothetical protein